MTLSGKNNAVINTYYINHTSKWTPIAPLIKRASAVFARPFYNYACLPIVSSANSRDAPIFTPSL